MNIIYAANDNYSGFLGISMLSLFDNNKNVEDITVYVVSNGISTDNINKLKSVADLYNRNIVIVESGDLNKKFEFEADLCGYNLTIMTRLFLGTLLDNSVEKIMYLDCDTIVYDELTEFYNEDIEDYYCAAIPEFILPDEHKEEIGLKSGDLYVNSGVLLINLKKWREDDLQTKFIEYFKEKNGKLLFADQDIINYCCKDMIKVASYKFNYAPNLRHFSSKAVNKIQPRYKEDNKALQKRPAVIHYMGDERPWVKWNHNPYRQIYYMYRDKSPWCDQKMIGGKFLYMQVYFILNMITRICPSFRVWFFKNIGRMKFKWFGKQ